MTSAIVIAGVRSGVGKTTIASGVMGALSRRGLRVQPFKAGPDYIDPTYHTIACGVPSRNLDTWLLPHPVAAELFHRAAGAADIAVVEGVMGVFDGHSSLDEDGSTAELAKLLDAPVILIADAGKVARSVAAEVLGYQQFDPDLRIAGVILNGVGSERHLEFCQPQIEATTGLPVVGWLPRRDDLIQPERHLGLIPTVEGTVLSEWYDALNAQIEQTIDLDAIVRIAKTAGRPSNTGSQVFPDERQPARAAIAVARDRAFSFYYQDSLDLLSAWGAEVIPFSPLDDSGLPDGVSGVYLGGGFPELFAEDLSRNDGMLPSIRSAIQRGLPVYGECGGLMYLGKSLSDLDGRQFPMVGAIPVVSSMEGRRLHLGYREVEACAEGPLLRAGEQVRGHEFHWSVLQNPPGEESAAYRVVNQAGRPEGFRQGSVWASYIHVHLGSRPGLARRFVDTCAATSGG
ncbi:MAG: cobyrinate a,c-diamide synthase [Chloroflexota bacterium]|nr:cobyrinate a,c-diamide synthase [Chloroflexota bacterium]MDE2683053.1 cobyrinate a,c-diamide synthase [Chloroflexota bacterium]